MVDTTNEITVFWLRLGVKQFGESILKYADTRCKPNTAPPHTLAAFAAKQLREAGE